jgi:hypothetical protein
MGHDLARLPAQEWKQGERVRHESGEAGFDTVRSTHFIVTPAKAGVEGN